MRPRANNAAAAEMVRHRDVLRGALDRGEAGDRTAEVEALADEGTALIDAIRRYLHGEISRDDLDRRATKEWLDRGRKVAEQLVSSASGAPWLPDDPRTAHLAQAGRRVRGVITDVRRAGLGNERVADLAMSVKVREPDGAETVLTRDLSIAVIRAPRVGDQVEVAYDEAEPDRFVYRPLAELPPA